MTCSRSHHTLLLKVTLKVFLCVHGREYIAARLQPRTTREPGPESWASEDGCYSFRFPRGGTISACGFDETRMAGSKLLVHYVRNWGLGWLEQGEGRVRCRLWAELGVSAA